ncbi:hypothetical protein SAMN00808754_2024 [Thermanaeromonas toyohensis ToBE]|uniref:DUF5343 domain-containing protein n=1 Tax=Thermanaeromonas toyohensis ToBE TaxID=698762 RepID=A0A1W1VYI3_9FIRM|nr:DUF5343 domain-containing protein [Thermanaeromonas toyohensis]SMB97914.1 hypothetical protein SAMN00808754_2024 [Thermanaeromonas toyohensis ToBE]
MKHDEQITVPYVPFRTFLTAIESLEQGLPSRIDRSVWPSFSGATQNQLLHAFRFLGLIDKDGYTQPILEKLVEDKENRKTILKELLMNSYSEVLKAIDLMKVSPMQLEETIRKYGVKGSTLQKAISFLLQACQYSGIALGPLLNNKTRSISSSSRRKKTFKVRENISNSDVVISDKSMKSYQIANDEVFGQGTSKTIELKSGGKLTLIASLNVFEMTKEDREFVFSLIDKLQEYERKLTAEPEQQQMSQFSKNTMF